MPITRFEAEDFEVHETPEMPKWPWAIYPIDNNKSWAIEPTRDGRAFEVTYYADYEGTDQIFIPAGAFRAALELNEKYPRGG